MSVKLDDVTFNGASGAAYSAEAYHPNQAFAPIAAVYAFCRQVTTDPSQFRYDVFYVGRTKNLPERLDGHENWSCASSRGANTVCVIPLAGEMQRAAVEDDLVKAYDPPCNKIAVALPGSLLSILASYENPYLSKK